MKQSAVVLVNVLSSSKKFAVASFSGPNTDDGSYLQEIIEPSLIVFSKTAIVEAINSLKGSADSQRNAGAALRKAVEQLSSYKDQGGSVLYVITGSSSDSTELELDVVEGLVQNNIQVVAVEVGGGAFNALSRLAPLARATFFNTTSFGNPSYFREINLAVVTYTEEPLTLDKKMVRLSVALFSSFCFGGTRTFQPIQLNRNAYFLMKGILRQRRCGKWFTRLDGYSGNGGWHRRRGLTFARRGIVHCLYQVQRWILVCLEQWSELY